MATTAKTTERVEVVPGVDLISPEEGKLLFDLRARELLGMSGEEFIRRYRAGEFEDPCQPEIAVLRFMIPFTED